MITRRTLLANATVSALTVVAGAGLSAIPALARNGNGNGNNNGNNNGGGNNNNRRNRHQRRHDRRHRRRNHQQNN